MLLPHLGSGVGDDAEGAPHPGAAEAGRGLGISVERHETREPESAGGKPPKLTQLSAEWVRLETPRVAPTSQSCLGTVDLTAATGARYDTEALLAGTF